jgi:ribosomal protein S18 acetylase RimI-like enzyme
MDGWRLSRKLLLHTAFAPGTYPVTYVWRRRGVVRGYLILGEISSLLPETPSPSPIVVMMLEVTRRYQRRGIGSALLNQAMRLAAGRGERSVSLAVRHGNEAHKFYERHGFVRVGEGEGCFAGETVYTRTL